MTHTILIEKESPMKRSILAFCLSFLCVVATLFVFARPQAALDKEACRKGCREDYAVCIKNSEATDEEAAAARRSACDGRYSRCLDGCE